MAYEFFKILEKRGLSPYKSLGIIAAMMLGLNSYFHSYIFTFITPTALIFVVSVAELLRKEIKDPIAHISTTLFGVVYTGWLMSHLILLMQMPQVVTHHEYYNIFGIKIRNGTSFALLPFVLTWTNDTGAFFIGRKFGKRKFLPRVSPKKTWEGVFGGAGCTLVASFIYRYVYAPYLSTGDCIVLSLLVAILAPLGDLVESIIKRDVNLKDASSTIPGHGGVLDRFDSLLFTTPAIYYYLRFFAAR